jgi:hypothetical protein
LRLTKTAPLSARRSSTRDTDKKMVENAALYRHFGFVETGRKQEHGFDQVYFRKALTGPVAGTQERVGPAERT